ncbi:SAM-dependent methyltransferase [Fulvivirga lutimaris]|uniref:SAM-dependent methyltransferase n=1 Tax=Fulvivirga lutimaris TaxID=1819566 RepID=UPI0012BD4CC0|nr:SAM-dependent methyltransferase [Fulvivirga lutimaris]MTI41932.1 SAM-dependent methyltransferase [Fulvivirga lutimaris]
MNTGKLYVIPTVIAENRETTIPQQVLSVVKETNIFLVENIRTARRYISSLKLGLTIEDLEFSLLDKKTANEEISRIMQPLLAGKDIGILSESGCPGIADPGAKAVEWAHRNGIKVIPLVGPSSLLLALMGSGFNGQKFCFHGYLPIDKKPLEAEIRRLTVESNRFNQTQIFIETPYRNNQLLKTILAVCDNSTQLCVARDLTGEQEFIETHAIAQWKNQNIDLHKVPTVFLIYAGN